jgi:hypothetical protein
MLTSAPYSVAFVSPQRWRTLKKNSKTLAS